MSAHPSAPLTLVLDTQIVLDWLLFKDAALDTLRDAINTQRVVIVSHDFARQELARVLNYPQFELNTSQQQAILDAYLRQTQQAPLDPCFRVDNLLLPERFPQCRDTDDQPFLALCFHTKADALITRDKALLVLRKRSRQFGVRIMDCQELANLL